MIKYILNINKYNCCFFGGQLKTPNSPQKLECYKQKININSLNKSFHNFMMPSKIWVKIWVKTFQILYKNLNWKTKINRTLKVFLCQMWTQHWLNKQCMFHNPQTTVHIYDVCFLLYTSSWTTYMYMYLLSSASIDTTCILWPANYLLSVLWHFSDISIVTIWSIAFYRYHTHTL